MSKNYTWEKCNVNPLPCIAPSEPTSNKEARRGEEKERNIQDVCFLQTLAVRMSCKARMGDDQEA
jgi:hypothetical protein